MRDPRIPRILLAIFAGCLMSNAALGQERPALCDFIEHVIAAKADVFSAIRGTEEELYGVKIGLYAGTLVPSPNASCTVGPPFERNGKTEPAIYMCELGRAKSMAAIKPSYDQFKAALAQCYPDIQFKEGSRGSDATHNEQWFFYGSNARATFTMEAVDNRYMIDTAPDMVNDTTKNMPASFKFTIRPVP